MRTRTLAVIGCLLLSATFSSLTAAKKLALTLQRVGEMIISVDPSFHQDFGLSYPVTYKLRIPAGSSALKVYEKYHEAAAWSQLPEKTSGDHFNGEEAVRFDYGAEAAYVSVAFDSSSDDIFLNVVDGSGQGVPIEFQNVCRYYDDRQAAVTFTADDWKEYTNLEFLKAVHTLRSYRIPVTTAIITGGCIQSTWQTIQQELDSGYVEAASHTRSHLDPPYPDPVSEIVGSKQDILANLTLPPHFRKGSQGYVYTWIAPFGSTTSETEELVSQARYIVDRGVFASSGAFSAWDASAGRYAMDGKSIEMGALYGGFTDLDALNGRFDAALAGGTIYHVLIHPHDLAATDEWSKGYIQGHLAHISNRTNVWYVNFGTLYVYHLLQDDAAGAIQTASGAPLIVAQPAGVSTTQGETAIFSVTASGSAPLMYQWQRNGVDIPGATNALYVTPALTQADSGAVYDCVVSNSIGSVTTDNAALSVLPLVTNVVTNGSFESGSAPWTFYSNGAASFTMTSSGSDGSKAAKVSITTEGTNVQLYQPNVTLQPNTDYRLTFDAYSNSGHDLELNLTRHVSPYTNYGLSSRKVDLGTSWQSYSVTFTTSGFSGTASDGRLWFWLAPYGVSEDEYYIDNVTLTRVSDLAPPISPPQITGQPAAQTVIAGQTASFAVTATGTAPLNYQWQRNNIDIVGATSFFYTTPITTSADSGALYHCRVSNSGGSATSSEAPLTVITAHPPVVMLDPRDTTVQEGHSVHFSVAATGDAPLTYQWQRNAADVPGANASSYNLAAAICADSGAVFHCIVSNAVGKDTSAAAVLRVLSIPPTIAVQPVAQTVMAGQTATFSLTATGTAPLFYQWQKDSTDIPGATDTSYTTPGTGSADSGAIFRCVVRNIAGSVASTWVHLTVITPRPAKVALDPCDTTVQEGHPAHFTVAATGTEPLIYQWQKNGVDISGATSPSCSLAAAARSDSGASFRCIVANGIGKDTSAAGVLHVLPAPPVITSQPTATTVIAGQTATFSLTAKGSLPLAYLWQKNSIDIPEADDSSYTTPATTTADSGSFFRCIISNSAGNDTSAQARLTIITLYPAVVIVDPHDSTVVDGHPATFSVMAVGTAPIAYQWQKNDTDIAGATAASYTTPAAIHADSGVAFRCIVSNGTGKDTSAAACLSVLPSPPLISVQPVARTVNVGGTATFSVTARGTPPLMYQWQKSSSNIPGATDSTYATPAASAADSGALFRCIVSNPVGRDTSTQVQLAVVSVFPAVVTAGPRDTTVGEGHTATFAVVATGTAPMTYQWQKNGAELSGATASSYTTSPTMYADSGAAFRCLVSNSAGKDTSGAAFLHVLPIPPVITTQPTNQTALAGQTATFSVTASGSAPLAYQWEKDGHPISGAAGTSYTTAATTATDNGAAFRCVVGNSAGAVTSQTALLSVTTTPPVIPNALANGTFEGGIASWSFYTSGVGSFSPVSPGSSGIGQAMQVAITTEGTNVQLYQSGITLQSNTSYQVSFDAYSSSGHDMELSLQQHGSPYTNYGLPIRKFDLTTTWQTFTVTFTTSGFASAVSDARLMIWLAPYGAAGDRFYLDNILLAKVTDLAPMPPAIAVQPVNRSIAVGQTATFSVTATGTAPLSYQWQRNYIDIAGATSTSYTTPITTSADSGALYRCRVSNIAGSASSATAQLSVFTPQPPVVTVDPRDTTVQDGRAAQFAVVAIGSQPLAYQWQKNGTDMVGATAATYSMAAAARSDSGAAFRCIISNSAGKDTSAAAHLSVLAAPPVVTAQPSNQTVTAGQTASFSVIATGTPPLTYQWQNNGSPISGATSSSFTTAATVATDSGKSFRCVVTNSVSSVTSQAALLIVTMAPPVIPNAVANGNFENGTTGWTFYSDGVAAYATSTPGSSGSGNAMQVTITTEGTNVQIYQYGIMLQPNTSYQLSFDAYSSSGHDVEFSLQQHGSPYTNYGLASRRFDLGTNWQSFSVVFTTSGFTNAVSDARLMAWLAPYDVAGDRFYVDNVQLAKTSDLVPTPPVITVQPVTQTVTAGQTAAFSITASGTAPLAYQWQKNSADIAGATNSSYTTPATASADSGATYRCVVTNPAGSLTSQSALLCVSSAAPTILTNGTFESGTSGWSFYTNGAGSYSAVSPGATGSGKALEVVITTEGTNVQLYQYGITLQPNTSYRLNFDGYSTAGHDLEVTLSQHVSPYTSYGLSGRVFNLTTSWQSFSVTFTTSGFSSTIGDARLWFWLAPYDAAGDKFYLDNIVLTTTPGMEVLAGMEQPTHITTIVPREFLLEGNYPNPFNPSTTVRYGLPEPATVSVIVYSILGQEVARLINGYQQAGIYQVQWDGRPTEQLRGTLSSGVYLCRMVATTSSGKNYVATGRMVLMK